MACQNPIDCLLGSVLPQPTPEQLEQLNQADPVAQAAVAPFLTGQHPADILISRMPRFPGVPPAPATAPQYGIAPPGDDQ